MPSLRVLRSPAERPAGAGLTTAASPGGPFDAPPAGGGSAVLMPVSWRIKNDLVWLESSEQATVDERGQARVRHVLLETIHDPDWD